MSDGRHIFTHSDVLPSVYSTVFIYGTFILFYCHKIPYKVF